jgi:hypothetical protein
LNPSPPAPPTGRTTPVNASRHNLRDAKLIEAVRLPFHFPIRKSPEWPDLKIHVGMSEYPCTGIDKAILKFVLQDRKISQIVSVKVSIFFRSFVRQLLPDRALLPVLKALFWPACKTSGPLPFASLRSLRRTRRCHSGAKFPVKKWPPNFFG